MNKFWAIKVVSNTNKLIPHVKPGMYLMSGSTGGYCGPDLPTLNPVASVTGATLFETAWDAKKRWMSGTMVGVTVTYVCFAEVT